MNRDETLAEELYVALGWSGCDGSRWGRMSDTYRARWHDMAEKLASVLAVRDRVVAATAAETALGVLRDVVLDYGHLCDSPTTCACSIARAARLDKEESKP